MKKVFSIEKYTSQCAKDGFVPEYGQGLRWAIRSEGKTKEEMNSMGLGTCDEWMIELPDPIPQ